MSRPMQYVAPVGAVTGGLFGQPHPADTVSAWYFDAKFNYTETGFLDAPDQTPSGSVRALVCGAIVLGVATELRP